jgi:serine/threonine protein kinase
MDGRPDVLKVCDSCYVQRVIVTIVGSLIFVHRLLFEMSGNNKVTFADTAGTLKVGPKKKKVLAKHTLIGVYQLGDCIGKGAFGTVYRGLNSVTGEVVAIKQFELDRVSADDSESFTTEIRILKDLRHTNIVQYIDFIKSDSHLNLILEYVEQGSLLNIVKQFGSLSENLVALYIGQTLDGLQYLHSKHVTHCDIKCANILTTKKGELKLTDFGVSKTLAKAESGSLTEEAVGTPYWMGKPFLHKSF